MIKIGIDARCLEWGRGGVARYLVNVLTDWALDKDSENRYVLYFQNKIPEDDFLKSDNFELRLIKGPQDRKSVV